MSAQDVTGSPLRVGDWVRFISDAARERISVKAYRRFQIVRYFGRGQFIVRGDAPVDARHHLEDGETWWTPSELLRLDVGAALLNEEDVGRLEESDGYASDE